MPRILLTHTQANYENYYGARALAALQECGEVVRNTTGRVLDDPALLAAMAQGVDVVVADRATPAPAAFFAATTDLRAFCRVAVDISTIDVAAATAHGVLVTRATPGFVTSVAELAVGFMVDLARGITEAAAAFQAGKLPSARRGRQLSGATLGIIGYGAIGRRLAALGQALGMTVIVTDPYATVDAGLRQIGLDDLLADSDFVVCLAPATPETAGMMNAAAFARMRRGAYFINLSRAGLIDEAALASALASGHLAGAALDVGSAPDQMPPPFLASRPDVLATPHVGGLTPEAAEHQAFDTVRQVAAITAGKMPPGAVNPEAWTQRDAS
jgi:D-3-phosphoglycerate dehydrogenase / 2-oxoglutarate reductase